MKSKISFSVLAVAFIFIGFTSCKKDKASSEINATNVSGNYKVTAVKVNGADFYSYLDECSKDNIFSLKSDMTVAYQDLGIKCNPDDSGIGTWSLTGSKITILTDANADDYNGTISSFNGTTLVITETDASSGTSITYETTFQKQ